MGYLNKQNHLTITMLINAHLMSGFFFGLMAYLWTGRIKYQTYAFYFMSEQKLEVFCVIRC